MLTNFWQRRLSV